jgi:methionyl-tRNA formyltransferase
MKLAIIGRTRMLYDTALLLKQQGHQINVVITAEAAPEYTHTEEDFRQLADTIGVPLILTNNLDNPKVNELCQGLDIGISINWKTLIHERHINLFRLGILNAHHGDLPQYRGNACSNWAISKGDNKITTSIHFMEGGKLDCGRIVSQKHLYLDENATITDVYSWSEKVIPELFVEVLNNLQSDENYTLKYADPDSSESFRCYPRLPEDGFIEWSTSVKDIHNLIRAVCYPFAGAYTYHVYKGEIKKMIILKSRIVQHRMKDLAMPGHVLKNDKHSGESWVKCGDGILALAKCRYEDETGAFLPGQRWKSIRMRLGIRVEDWMYSMINAQKA